MFLFIFIFFIIFSMDVKKLKFKIFLEDKINNNKIKGITIDNMKFLFNKSSTSLFGNLISAKLFYKINQLNSHNKLGDLFEIEYYFKDIKKIITILSLITDLEYFIRIKILENENNDKMIID